MESAGENFHFRFLTPEALKLALQQVWLNEFCVIAPSNTQIVVIFKNNFFIILKILKFARGRLFFRANGCTGSKNIFKKHKKQSQYIEFQHIDF